MRRRDLARLGIAAAAGGVLPARSNSARGGAADQPGPRLHLFSKPLQWLGYDELAETTAAAGYIGIELTVRPGGHVEPERVAVDLPRATAAARKQGLSIGMIVTAINSADDPQAQRLLETAAQEGVAVYRMAYLKYDEALGVTKSLDGLRRRMAALEELNRRCGVTGCYQNHHGSTGGRVGGSIWDIHALLEGRDPRWIGCQYDVRHAVSESTGSWDVGLGLIAPSIRSLCFKDFRWESVDSCRPVEIPAGRGVVPWQRFLALLATLGVDAPMSVHCEWPLFDASQASLPVPQRRAIAARGLRQDREFLAATIAAARRP
jgi:L-ribulose-5-phosphate 3-epimerase